MKKMVSDSQALDEVVVTGTRRDTFGSDRTGAQTSIGRRELTRLPTIQRSASDFTRPEPTASNGPFAGRNDQFNNFSLDGAIFNNPFGSDAATPGGQTNAQPISLDAIDQTQVTTAPYDVTRSGFTGASVNTDSFRSLLNRFDTAVESWKGPNHLVFFVIALKKFKKRKLWAWIALDRARFRVPDLVDSSKEVAIGRGPWDKVKGRGRSGVQLGRPGGLQEVAVASEACGTKEGDNEHRGERLERETSPQV